MLNSDRTPLRKNYNALLLQTKKTDFKQKQRTRTAQSAVCNVGFHTQADGFQGYKVSISPQSLRDALWHLTVWPAPYTLVESDPKGHRQDVSGGFVPRFGIWNNYEVADSYTECLISACEHVESPRWRLASSIIMQEILLVNNLRRWVRTTSCLKKPCEDSDTNWS